MKVKLQSFNAFISLILVWSLFLHTVPVQAQDVVTSEDISGGSSVFVFRKSRAATQAKFASRATVKRNTAQKTQSRKSIKEQVAKVTPQREKVKKVDPKLIASNNTGTTGTGKTGKGKTGTGKTGNTNGNNGGDDTAVKVSPEELSNVMASSAEVFMERGQHELAIPYFRDALKNFPNNTPAKLGLSEALTRRAETAFDKDDFDTAIKSYEEAIKYDDKNSAAYAGLASVYENKDQTDLALTNYEKALAANSSLTELYAPLGAIYYQKGEIAKADDLLTKAVTLKAEDDQTQYFLGLIRYKQNRNDEALGMLSKSVKINPTAEGNYYLGEIYDRLDKENEAIAAYNQAISLNKNYAEAWGDLGAVYYNRKRYPEAITAYENAIRSKNDRFEYYENLGDVYRQLKQYGKAEGPYGLAITLAERDPKAKDDKTAMADLYSKYGFVLGYASKWGSAIDALNKAVAISPDTVDYTNLGWAYYNSARLDLVEKEKAAKSGMTAESQKYATIAQTKLENGRNALLKATAIDKNFFPSYMNLGMTQTDLGDYQGAIESLKRCIQLRDKWALAYNELGYAYQVSGNLGEAVNNFKKAVDIDKNYVTALYNWSLTEMLRGNDKEARKIQDRLRKLDPNRANLLELEFMKPQNMIKQKIDSKNPLNKVRIPY